MPGERATHQDLVVIGLNLCRNKAGLDEAGMAELLDHDTPTVAAFQEAYQPARPRIGRIIENLGYQAIFPHSKMDLAFAVSPDLRVVGTDELVFPGKFGRSISTKGPWARELGLFSVQVVEEEAADEAKPHRITTAHDPTYIMVPARKEVAAWRSLLMPDLTAGVNLHALALDHNSVAWQENQFDQDQAAWGGQRLLPSGQVTYVRPSSRPNEYNHDPGAKGFALDGIHASVPEGHELVDLSARQAVNLRANQVGFRTEVKAVKASDHRAIVATLSVPKAYSEHEQSQNNVERTKLTPDLEIDSILDITPQLLEEMGIRHLLIDFDQTLIAPAEKQIRNEFIKHLLHLQQSGSVQTLNLASESMRNIRKLARPLRPYGLFRHFLSRGKPIFKSNPKFYSRILEALDADPSTVLMVGDEYLRDILTANQVGIKTAKVTPLGKDYRIFRRRRKRDSQALSLARSLQG